MLRARPLAATLAATMLTALSFGPLSGLVMAATPANPPDLALYANGWDATYHEPFGAVPTASKLTLRLRSATIVTKASVYLLNFNASKTFIYPMTVVSHGSGSELWSATIKMPANAQQMRYYFGAQAGSTVEGYGDNANAPDGGPGQTYTGGYVNPYLQTVYLKSFQTPSWMRKAVIYQIFPDRFYDGNKANDTLEKTGTTYGYVTTYFHNNWSDIPFDGNPCYSCDFYGGDLQGVIAKLPYLHQLGITAIYLNPIFLAPSDHKYDTSNFMKIDPEFGTLHTFQTLTKQAKKDGIRLILDGVFEDTGSDSIYFNQYAQFSDTGAYQSQTSPYYSWYTFYTWPNSYADFSGYPWLPMLKENPAVENYIFAGKHSVAKYWLDQGASGWRLDSADRLSPGYWQTFRSAIKKGHPQSVIIAEPMNWTSDMTSSLLGNTWDGVMNYRFREPVIDFFAQGNGASNPTGPIQASQFLASEMSVLSETPRPAALSSMNLVDSHDTERILTSLNGDKNALKLVALFQMTWLGAPTVLYGDETDLQGSDNNVARATFPWSSQDQPLETYYSGLIHMRLKYDALTQGRVSPLYSDDGQRTVAYLRRWGNQSIVVVLNDSTQAVSVSFPAPQLANGTALTSILPGDTTQTSVSQGKITLSVPAMSGEVLLAK